METNYKDFSEYLIDTNYKDFCEYLSVYLDKKIIKTEHVLIDDEEFVKAFSSIEEIENDCPFAICPIDELFGDNE